MEKARNMCEHQSINTNKKVNNEKNEKMRNGRE